MAKRLRSKAWQHVEELWEELPKKHRTVEVLKKMAECAKVPPAVIEDRTRILEKAHTDEAVK